MWQWYELQHVWWQPWCLLAGQRSYVYNEWIRWHQKRMDQVYIRRHSTALSDMLAAVYAMSLALHAIRLHTRWHAVPRVLCYQEACCFLALDCCSISKMILSRQHLLLYWPNLSLYLPNNKGIYLLGNDISSHKLNMSLKSPPSLSENTQLHCWNGVTTSQF